MQYYEKISIKLKRKFYHNYVMYVFIRILLFSLHREIIKIQKECSHVTRKCLD